MKIMKKRAGFTLVELLGVIGILSLILLISIPTYLNLRDSTLQREYDNVVSYIESSAARYAQDTSITTVSVEKLIENGYIEPDDETDIYNPINGESLNCYIVTSTFEDGNYTSTFTEDNLIQDGACQTYEETSEFEICVYNEEGVCERVEDGIWYNRDVTLGVIINDSLNATDIRYVWSSSAGDSGTDSIYYTSTQEIKTATYSVALTMQSEGRTITGTANKNINIDKRSPVVTDIEIQDEFIWKNANKQVTITASDFMGSGVSGIYVGSSSTCPTNSGEYQTATNNIYSITLDNGNYYACVIDKVGNVSESYAFTVSRIDKIAPVYSSKSGSMTSNTIPQVTYTDDGGSGINKVQYYVSSSATVPSSSSSGWKDYSGISYSASCGTTYYLFAKGIDNAGNETVYQTYADTYYYSCPRSNSGSSSGGTKSNNSNRTSGSTNTCDWQCQMQNNAEKWHECTTASCRSNLEATNQNIANNNCSGCTLSNSGVWYDSKGDRVTWKDSSSSSSSSSSSKKSSSSTSKASGTGSSSKSRSSGSSSLINRVISSISKLFGR